MNSPRESVERLLESLEPPHSPPALRTPVLASARTALAKPPIRDRWSALRWSPPLRLAWLGGVVLLALGHLLISRTSPARVIERSQPSAALPLVRSIGNPGDELAEIVALPRIDPAARSLAELIPSESTEPAQTGATGARAPGAKRGAA